MDFLRLLFDSSGFVPRWRCGEWTATHGWFHVLSDLGVWSAYVAIPCVLTYFLLKRKDLPYPRVLTLFAMFILACGFTHMMDAVMFWWPVYRLAGAFKFFTAVVSWTTVFALAQIVPKVMRLRSAEELEQEIDARTRAENALQQVNSELKGRVDALRASEERFRLLVEGTKEYAIFLLDPAGNIASWNPGAERIKQYRADEVLGRHFSLFYSSDDQKTGIPEQELKTAAATGKCENEGWRIRKDGTKFFANVLVTALRDEAGKLCGFSKITRDITEKLEAQENARRLFHEEAARKAAEEQAQLVHQQRELLRVTLASIGDGVISTDAEHRVTFLNAVAQRLTGWESTAAHGLPLDSIYQIEPEPAAEPAATKPAKANEQSNGTGPADFAGRALLLARDGGRRPIDQAASPIRDAEGEVLGSIVVFRDVTEQRRAELANRILAEVSGALVGPLHYQSILRRVAELAVPTLGDVCFFDVLAADMTLDRVGWTHADPAMAPKGDMVRELMPSLDSEHHPIARVLRTGQAEMFLDVTDDWLRSIANGDKHLAFLRSLDISSVICAPMLVGQRRIGALTFVSRKPRQHTADELRLATEIARRAALTVENAQLFNQLRDADQRKNEFLAVLAHELRNPLAPIVNALQIIRLSGDRTENVTTLRAMMERQVQQMVHLVDDLLDVSRITSGKIVLRKERLDLSSVVQSAVEASRPAITAARHELTVSLATEPLYVDGDKTRLAQVISNLLANGAKYTPDGGRIWLSSSREAEQAVIRVRDDGLGIPSDMLPQIFEMFTQVDRNLGRSQGGLGIGLTLVRRLLTLHDGTIEAYSEGPGKGSEFVVRLPLAPTYESQRANASFDGEEAKTAPVSNLRILVVDDNRDSAESLAVLLRITGADVRTAHDGPEALAQAADFRPQLVLLDIGLPGISGYDVARRMRQMPELKEVVLVAQTGWGQDEDKRRSQDAGFDAHLVKPIGATALETLLEQMSRGGRDAVGGPAAKL